MPIVLSSTLFRTSFGWMGLVGSSQGLCRVFLPQPTETQVLRLLSDNYAETFSDPSIFGDLPDRLEAYFKGQPVSFPNKLDLIGRTPFHRRVLEVTYSIPPGQTRSYAWVAEQAGSPKAARAVGQAMARNPVPIVVPCHRVIASDGNLGGYGGGLEMKSRLLDMEARALGH